MEWGEEYSLFSGSVTEQRCGEKKIVCFSGSVTGECCGEKKIVF